MDALISLGIGLIVAVQSFSTWLDAPMKLFSFFGSPDFFLIFVPLIYWSLDERLGVRVWFMLLAGGAFTEFFKMALHTPRPYWVSAKVRILATDPGFGVPSGHAEIAAGFWGMLAAYYRKAWVWIAAAVLVFIIGVSRVYLGVHFPHGVLAGWVLGALTLWAFVKLWEPVEARLKQASFWSQVGLAFAVSLAVVALGAGIVYLSRGFVLPAEWIANATRDGNLAPNPFSMDILITVAGSLLGSCWGLAWMAPRGGFKAAGPPWKRAGRYMVGLVGLLVLYAGLKAVFPTGDTPIAYSFRYVRYTLMGLWAFAGAPWVFEKLNLTEKPG